MQEYNLYIFSFIPVVIFYNYCWLTTKNLCLRSIRSWHALTLMSLEQQQDAVSTYVYVVSTFTLPPENGDTMNLVAVQYIRVPLLYTT